MKAGQFQTYAVTLVGLMLLTTYSSGGLCWAVSTPTISGWPPL